jgi:hypothetical protein
MHNTKSNKYKIPNGEFTQTVFEKQNDLPEHTHWSLLQTMIKDNEIRLVLRGKGRRPNIYQGL